LRRQIALAQVAGRTGRDDIFPGGLATLAARNDVIERQILRRPAILAGETIPQEHVEPGEGGLAGGRDKGFQ